MALLKMVSRLENTLDDLTLPVKHKGITKQVINHNFVLLLMQIIQLFIINTLFKLDVPYN